MDAIKKRILILENDADTLFILKRVLLGSGFNVRSSDSALSLINGQGELPDLFLVDRDLPTIDGVDVCKYLKLNRVTRTIPIVMISSYRMAMKAKRIGVEEFLSKPFEVERLLKAVKRQLGRKRKEEMKS